MKKIFLIIGIMILLSGCSAKDMLVGGRTFAGRLTDLSNVDTTTLESGFILSYDGSIWNSTSTVDGSITVNTGFLLNNDIGNNSIDGLTNENAITISGDELTVASGDIFITNANALTFTNSNIEFRLNNDEVLTLDSVSTSAVNELLIQNSTTTNAVQIQTAGGDTNIDLAIMPKGTGNVGIGTNVPDNLLTINGNYGGFAEGDEILIPTSGFNARLFGGDTTALGSNLITITTSKSLNIQIDNDDNATTEVFEIGSNSTSADGVNYSSLFRVQEDGKVGIGTTTPNSELSVTGEVSITGISGDGTGSVVCIKADGDLGTCSDQPDGSGNCTCS